MVTKVATGWEFLFSAGAVITLVVAGVGVLVLMGGPATADMEDWPPLTMTYSVKMPVNYSSITQVRRPTYDSRTSWIEGVIQADDIEINVGTFNDMGSYQKLEDGQYITYDVTVGHTRTETVSAGIVMIPRSGLMPSPIDVLEDVYMKELASVSTLTKVCFDGVCKENAPGWELRDGNRVVVFADDDMGIPVKIGNFTVTEVRVQGSRDPVR